MGNADSSFISDLFSWLKSWNRSDGIALCALLLSVVSALVTAKISLDADQRTREADMRAAEAIAISLGDKVRTLATHAQVSAQFLEAFSLSKKAHPQKDLEINLLAKEFIHSGSLPSFSLSGEQLGLLARSNSNAALKLTACASQNADIEEDFKRLENSNLTSPFKPQIVFQLLSYRLYKLSEACNVAVQSLISLSPNSKWNEVPSRDTVGELMAAQELRRLRNTQGLAPNITWASDPHEANQEAARNKN